MSDTNEEREGAPRTVEWDGTSWDWYPYGRGWSTTAYKETLQINGECGYRWRVGKSGDWTEALDFESAAHAALEAWINAPAESCRWCRAEPWGDPSEHEQDCCPYRQGYEIGRDRRRIDTAIFQGAVKMLVRQHGELTERELLGWATDADLERLSEIREILDQHRMDVLRQADAKQGQS